MQHRHKTRFIDRITATRASWAPLALRLPVGAIFIAHGAQKLFGWFGGKGLDATAHFMASLGLTPSFQMAVLAGGAEFFGGLALLIGLLVRPAAAALVATMVVAVATVHLDKGLFLANGGYEFALALGGAALSLLISGAGRGSFDAALSTRPPAPAPYQGRPLRTVR